MPIRKALPEDYESIYKMGFDVWGDGQDLADYLEQCRRSPKYRTGCWYVLVNERGELCSTLIRYVLSPGICGIGSIATPPSLRRKGYASTIVREALQLFEGEGFKTSYLFSDIDPAFYTRLGFTALPDRYQHHEGSVCMVRGIEIETIEQNPAFEPPKYF